MRIGGILASLPTLAVAMLLIVIARRFERDEDSVRTLWALACYFAAAILILIGSIRIIGRSLRAVDRTDPVPGRFAPFEDRSEPRHRRPR